MLTLASVQVYNSLLRPGEEGAPHVDWEISCGEGAASTSCSRRRSWSAWQSPGHFPRLRGTAVDDLTITREELERMDRLYIIACGSSYHVGVAAKYFWELLGRILVEVTLVSEFRYCDPIVTDRPWPW